jgi:hypothetical protein
MTKLILGITTFLLSMTALAIAAPSDAHAQACVAKHFAWMEHQPADHKSIHKVRAQLVMVRDEQASGMDFVAQGTADLVYNPAVSSGGTIVMEAFSANLPLTFSDTGWSPNVQVVLAWNGAYATLAWTNSFWNIVDTVAEGVCVDDNTVVYAVPGHVSYVIRLLDIDQMNIVPPGTQGL